MIYIFLMFLLVGCKNGKLPGSDARKIPYDPKERVKRNLEQGKGFRLNNMINKKITKLRKEDARTEQDYNNIVHLLNNG